MNKIKCFIIATLSLLVVGITLLSVFGFNQTADYKESYELQVSIDQRAAGATDVLSASVDEYFANKGIAPVCGGKQVIDDGMGLLFKFDSDVSSHATEIKQFIETKLLSSGINTAEITAVEVIVNASIVKEGEGFEDWMLLVGSAVAVVCILVYALIMVKLTGALATLFSAVLSALTFVALMAITRLPAAPFVTIGCVFAGILGGVLALSSIARYREEDKNTANENLSTKELIEKMLKLEKKKYLLVLISVALVGLALIATMASYFMIAGAQLIVVSVVATASSYFGVPLLWNAIKNK